jgi:FAD/FMN-containing dehydrogenase
VTIRGTFARAVDLAAAETIVEELQSGPAPMAAVQLRVLGGAMARVPADATAFAHRDAALMATLAAIDPDPAAGPAYEPWLDDVATRLSGGETAVYSAFLGDEGEARVRAAYPGATWDRLAAVKAEYDPDNLFRRNQNVPPAAYAELADSRR